MLHLVTSAVCHWEMMEQSVTYVKVAVALVCIASTLRLCWRSTYTVLCHCQPLNQIIVFRCRFRTGITAPVKQDRLANAGSSPCEALPTSPDCIVVIGGGHCQDARKTLASNLCLKFVIFPTLASTDAPCSSWAVVYDHEKLSIADLYATRQNPDLADVRPMLQHMCTPV